jgi:hypothetical protein
MTEEGTLLLFVLSAGGSELPFNCFFACNASALSTFVFLMNLGVALLLLLLVSSYQ